MSNHLTNLFTRRTLRGKRRQGGCFAGRPAESGVSTLEAALSVPLLILFFFVLMESYFLLSNYLSMSQVIREAVLTSTMATEPMTSNETFQGDQHQVCEPLLAAAKEHRITKGLSEQFIVFPPPCLHEVLRHRIERMMQSEGVRQCDKHSIGCVTTTSLTTSMLAHTGLIRIDLVVSYTPFFNIFPAMSYHVKATGGLANWTPSWW